MNMIQANEFIDRDGGRVTWRVMEIAAAISDGLCGHAISGMISDRKAARKKYDIDERAHIETLMKRYGYGVGAKKTALLGVLSKAFNVVSLAAGLSADGTQGEVQVELMECQRKLREERAKSSDLASRLDKANFRIDYYLDVDLEAENIALEERAGAAEYQIKKMKGILEACERERAEIKAERESHEMARKMSDKGYMVMLRERAETAMKLEAALAEAAALRADAERFNQMKKLMGGI